MITKIKCIVVDDEEYAADVVRNYIDRRDDLELLAICSNVFELMEKNESEQADLIFLDIQMPQIDGMQAIKILGEGKPKIILTTAFQEYAVEAFDLNVVDYLLKPFSYERFQKAVEKVKLLLSKVEIAKYAKSGLNQEESLQVFVKVRAYITEHKSFLNSELRLDDLAKQMQINRNHLSQAINTQAHETFWSFLNQFRLEEAKSRLRNPKYNHYTIEAIALDSGFNSVSGFNTIFKKMVGITPSEFRVTKADPKTS